MNYYTIVEISTHNTYDDCWIYANKCVYDVTTFIKQHPGGLNSIIKYAGEDCSYHYTFHSKTGKAEWGKYKIGQLKNENIKKFCIIN